MTDYINRSEAISALMAHRARAGDRAEVGEKTRQGDAAMKRGRPQHEAKTQFGRNLRALRKDMGLTVEQAALLMGISSASLYEYERGDSGCRADALAILADFYMVDMDALWRGQLWTGENWTK